VSTCTHCGGDLPAQAVFCPSCGRRTDLAADADDVPVDVQHAQPHYFGLGPPILVFSLGAGLLVLGVILLVAGSVAVGVIAIVLALCLLPTFLAGARRWPETPIARAGISTADRVRDEADVAVTSISTWSRAGRDVVRLRKDQFRLRRDLDAKIRELGRAVFEEDGRADELKAEAKELDDRISVNERALERTIAGARRRVRKDRAAVVATEVIRPDEANAPLGREAAPSGVFARSESASADSDLAQESGAVEVDAAQAGAGEGRGPDPADDVADAADVEQRS
jgi:hypothetical protein